MPKGQKREDLVPEMTINSLTLKQLEKRKYNKITRTYWKCLCVCGKYVTRRQDDIASGNAKSCGCQHPNYTYNGTNHFNWKGCGEISGEYFCLIKKGSESRNIEFNITIEEIWNIFLEQNKKCKLTDLPLTFTASHKKHRKTEQTASLDRIDSSKGYTLSNVQWIHKDINRMKNYYTQDRFIELCKLVAIKN